MGEYWSVGNLRASGLIFPLSPRPFSFVRRILWLCLRSLWLAISMSPRTATANHFAIEQTGFFLSSAHAVDGLCVLEEKEFLVLEKEDLLTWSPLCSPWMSFTRSPPALSDGEKPRHGSCGAIRREIHLDLRPFTTGVWANELASWPTSVFMNT